MKKKKNSRHRENKNTSTGEVPKQVIFNHYIEEMEEKSKEYKTTNKDVDFYLLQSIKNKDKVRDKIFNLVYFYDYNFVGNKDFMHIPNISNVLDNCLKYPIMLANKKCKNGNEEIIGAATIKAENNYSLKQNPYFPTCGEDVLTITGVLTRLYKNEANRIPGIGKDLFKSAIKSAYFINQEHKIRLITEVDCRNFKSLNAVTKAVKELKAEGINVNIFVAGYYEIKNKENDFIEAPTFILEVDLSGEKKLKDSYVELNYERCRKEFLFKDLSNTIKDNTQEVKKYLNRLENKSVIYTKIKPINALNIALTVGSSAEGNNREPSIDLLESVQSRVL